MEGDECEYRKTVRINWENTSTVQTIGGFGSDYSGCGQDVF